MEVIEDARAAFHGVGTGLVGRIAAASFAGVMAGAAAHGLLPATIYPLLRETISLVAALAVFVLSMVLSRLRVDRRPVLPAVQYSGLCVACGYDLLGQEPEADGCVVCPECGAAWRLGAAHAT